MAPRKKAPATQRDVSLLRGVKTPLSFFVLAVFVAESLLLAVLSRTAEKNPDLVIAAMIGMLFLLVILVGILAVYRPEALRGTRAGSVAPPAADLAGRWEMLMRTAEGRELLGAATIKQEPGQPYIKLLGEVLVPGRDSIIVTSVLGGLVEHELYIIYRNSDTDMGVAYGVVPDYRPSKLTLDYRDLVRAGGSNEPIGRIELTRSESVPKGLKRTPGGSA